jgi:type I restriction enzyme M protein
MDDNMNINNKKNQLISIFWEVFYLFRGVKVEDLQVVFLLISAFKDDVFKNSKHIELNDINEFTINRLYSSEKYFEIFQVYEHIIQLVDPKKLFEFYQMISQLDTEGQECLKLYFGEIFESLLKRYMAYISKKSGILTQPRELTNLVKGITGLNDHAKIYNPFSGLASYGTDLFKNQIYYGQELDDYTWALGMLRLLSHNKTSNLYYSSNDSIDNFKGHVIYESADSIDSWPEKQKFDLVVATPPFGMKLPRHLISELTGNPYRNVENYLIEKGISSLNKEGQFLAVFSLSFLFSRSPNDIELKEYLINNNLIDTIIQLPSSLLSNTSIPICLIVFKTISSREGYVKFIDASNFFIKDAKRNKVLKDKELLDLIDCNVENKFLKYVQIEDIYKNDFNLSVGRYFLKEVKGRKLHTFSNIIKGIKAPVNEKMKQVQIRNLKDDVFDSVLTSNELENTLIKRGTFRLIDESCLLIATRWNTLKPTFFKYTGEPIVISMALVALRLDEVVVDPIFIINEFSADYMQEQINSYRIGTVQPMLRKKDLENIVFQLPTMEEQKAKVSGINELSLRLRKIESEKENILSGIKKEETESSTSLSHILGKPLLSIGSSIEIIQNSLSKLDPNWKGFMISQNRQFTLSDAFDSISKNVKYIQELADKNTSLVSVSNFELNEIHFLKFLSEFVKDEKKSLNNSISIKLDIHEDIKEQMDNQVLIKGNPQKLRIVLVNLLDNAKRHAFINKEKSNKINIEILPFTSNEKEASYFNYDIDTKKSYVEVKVSNTGTSFPKDFKLKDYVRKNFAAGQARNSGLGGYEVNEIIKAHNEGKNALNIVSNKEDSEYSTTISFIIPII